MECYTYQEIKYTDPIFKEVDATYIIHLEGNGRLSAIKEQLKTYHPTRNVYILFNNGFRKCNKSTEINHPSLDLVDAYFTVFKHANNKKYENILVLEDDFMFNDKILEPYHAQSIETFLRNKIGDNYIYYLGTLPFIQLSLFGEHNRVILSTGTHACIYPRQFFEYLIFNVNQKDISDWDVYLNMYYSKYKYHTQLCYQLFPSIENLIMHSHSGNQYMKYFAFIPLVLLRFVGLDKNIYPGYNTFEFASILIFWFIVLTIICITIFKYLFIQKNYKWLNKKWHYYIYMYILSDDVYPIAVFVTFFLIILITYNINTYNINNVV